VTSAQTLVLEATDLEVEYTIRDGRVRSLDAATLAVKRGEITAVVGESGSGKTTLGLAAGRLLASNAVHVGGDLRVLGERVLDCDLETLRMLRREVLGFIFQDPVAALNPTMRVQRQLELLGSKGSGRASAAEALQDVGLSDIPRVLRAYPHELSGGMAQRVGIAMALLRRPQLLIADEPTAAVDATRRAQILELLVGRCRDHDCALLLLTHDLHTVAKWCSEIAVMYGGRVVETGPTAQVLARPAHPYTSALVNALPGDEGAGERLRAIPGVPPVLRGPSAGCAFAARCPDVLERCPSTRPVYARAGNRYVCCHLVSGQEPEEANGVAQNRASAGGTDVSQNGSAVRGPSTQARGRPAEQPLPEGGAE
jgi:peptide/nickel transport system ATP-binding protein